MKVAIVYNRITGEIVQSQYADVPFTQTDVDALLAGVKPTAKQLPYLWYEVDGQECHAPLGHAIAYCGHHPECGVVLLAAELPSHATQKILGGVVVPKTAEEISAALSAAAWVKARADRNSRLAASDWTRLDDAALTTDQKTAWATYRQALRDVPQKNPDPEVVVWPEAPK